MSAAEFDIRCEVFWASADAVHSPARVTSHASLWPARRERNVLGWRRRIDQMVCQRRCCRRRCRGRVALEAPDGISGHRQAVDATEGPIQCTVQVRALDADSKGRMRQRCRRIRYAPGCASGDRADTAQTCPVPTIAKPVRRRPVWLSLSLVDPLSPNRRRPADRVLKISPMTGP